MVKAYYYHLHIGLDRGPSCYQKRVLSIKACMHPPGKLHHSVRRPSAVLLPCTTQCGKHSKKFVVRYDGVKSQYDATLINMIEQESQELKRYQKSYGGRGDLTNYLITPLVQSNNSIYSSTY